MSDRSRVFRRKGSKCWYCWVPKPGGGVQPKTTHCTDRRAAEARASQLERVAVDPAYAASTQTTLERIMSDYSSDLVRQKRAGDTVAYYDKKFGVIARLLVDEGVGPKKFVRTYPLTRDIDHAALLHFIDARQAEGVMNTTILKEVRALGAAWSFARKTKLVHCSWDDISPKLDDDHVDRERALTHWELVGLAMVLPPHRMAVVAYASVSGCDYSAIWRALPQDVSADRSMVHIRGTKRASRLRDVPLPLEEQRSLLDWAIQHADGGIGDRLFSTWPNMRRDLADACEVLGIPRVSPNDLRRTYGNWVSEAGVEHPLIGAAMGHKDGRMAERIYAKLKGKRLGKVMDARVAETSAANERLMRAEAVETGLNASTAATLQNDANASKQAVLSVRGDGIEPPTRGFSIQAGPFGTSAKDSDSVHRWAPNERRQAADLPADRDLVDEDDDGPRAFRSPPPGVQDVVLECLREAYPLVLSGDRRAISALERGARALDGGGPC